MSRSVFPTGWAVHFGRLLAGDAPAGVGRTDVAGTLLGWTAAGPRRVVASVVGWMWVGWHVCDR